MSSVELIGPLLLGALVAMVSTANHRRLAAVLAEALVPPLQPLTPTDGDGAMPDRATSPSQQP